WMVRTVIIATILGIVVAVYTRPLYNRMQPRIGRSAAATVTILVVIVPVALLLAYSYSEITDVATYVSSHQDEIARKIDDAALETNVKGVMYGAIYSTFLTQALKSAILLMIFLALRIPLAGVLVILSFIIGFFPVVGSWSVYVPVGLWLLVFRNAPVQAIGL